MYKLRLSKYISGVDYDPVDKTTEFNFKINCETELSIRFIRNEFSSVALHVTDFSVKSSTIESINTFEKFRELFKILTGSSFDIDCL